MNPPVNDEIINPLRVNYFIEQKHKSKKSVLVFNDFMVWLNDQKPRVLSK